MDSEHCYQQVVCSLPTLDFSLKTPIFCKRIQCTVLKNAKSLNIKDLQDTQNSDYKPAYKKYQKTAETQLQNVPTELAEIVAVWPELPEYIKAAIKALVQTHTKESD